MMIAGFRGLLALFGWKSVKLRPVLRVVDSCTIVVAVVDTCRLAVSITDTSTV
jgi:hypothetical protein